MNVTRYLLRQIRRGHKTIRFHLCVVKTQTHQQCKRFHQFKVAIVIQMNININANSSLFHPYMAIMNAFIERDKYLIRTKRSVPNEITGSSSVPHTTTQTPLPNTTDHVESNMCHVHPWTLQFDSIGWDYLLAPRSYSPNLCIGVCPSFLFENDIYNHTLHSGIIDLYRFTHSLADDAIPRRSCCVPVEYAPQSVLFQGRHGIHEIIRMEEMIVTACGCL